jgi:YggT family protein
MNPVQIITSFVGLYSFLVLIRCLLTWFPNIDFASQPFRTVAELTDPYLNLFRSFIPPLGGIDLSPMVAIFALQFVSNALSSLLGGTLAAYSNQFNLLG